MICVNMIGGQQAKMPCFGASQAPGAFLKLVARQTIPSHGTSSPLQRSWLLLLNSRKIMIAKTEGGSVVVTI